jgi:alpha-amylase
MVTTFAEALAGVPSGGLAYLPTASYREMEGWSLPADGARRLARLEAELGNDRLAGPDGALVRGAHWRNFMVKYAEANRMHKKMVALSALCRAAGDPEEVRRAIGRAQCNDAYWHGVFGGLYLPHLRDAVWHQLARAEQGLRAGDALAWEVCDLDGDGHDELWIHDATFSAILSPGRGGVIEEYSVFEHGINYANTLTRRREAYHEAAIAGNGAPGHHDADGAPSIHALEAGMRLTELPPLDPEPRALIRERFLDPEVNEAMYQRGDYEAAWSVTHARLLMTVEAVSGGVEVTFDNSEAGVPIFQKRYQFLSGGGLRAMYRWNPAARRPGTVFAPEISYAGPMEITASPSAPLWSYDIVTVAKSEKALEQTTQGRAVTPRWPATAGEAHLSIRVAGRA